MIMRWFGSGIVEQLPVLRRYARSLTRDEAAAEDLVHDALLLACEKRETFRANGNLRAWLLSIVHNRFVSDRRRRDAEQGRMARIANTAEAHSPPAQEHALRLATLARAFARLPDEQRAVLHLVVIEGLPYQEAALALGVPVGTVMSRLSRARVSLRALEGLPQAEQRPDQRLRIVGGGDDGRR